MTNDEAEKLARETLTRMQRERTVSALSWDDISLLCDHILSGSMKREIENAAYERAAKVAIDDANLGRADLDDPPLEALAFARVLAAERIANGIAALIQPPAQQKENGE